MLDRFLSMSVFVAAADQRSFTAAADQFGISPTMVGKHIRMLEERVGARLLNRTTRRQSLTEVGRIYYERCRELLAGVEAAEASADEMRATPRGVLRVHAPVSFGTQRLAPALADYLSRYPDVDIDLALADRVIDLVEEGYEAALRIGPLTDANLVARPLRPYRMWLCAAPKYLEARGVPEAVADLAAHNCLGFANWQKRDPARLRQAERADSTEARGRLMPNIWRLRQAERTESVEARGRLVVNNGQALKMAAIAGLGVIMQPEVLVADEVAAGRLTRILTNYEPPSRPMHLVYLADRRPTAKLRSFIEFAIEQFG